VDGKVCGDGHGKCHGMMNTREKHHGDASISKMSFESRSGHRFNFGRIIQVLEY